MSLERLTPGQWAWMKTQALKAVLQVVSLTIPRMLFPGRLGKRLADESRQCRGLILVLPGIEGESTLNHNIAYGLSDAGIPDAIEIFDWTRGRLLLFDNLMNRSRNARQADRLADRIRQYQGEYPGRPVHLVGHSGGAALAVMVLERLGADRPITAAVLLAPALSPRYNLAPALRATVCGIHSLYSRYDTFYLGAGTLILGTIDRKRVFAAGKVGFQVPEGLPPADADVYRTKLRQVTWQYGMLADGHPGGHIGSSDRRFVRKWVSPILVDHRA
jgi:pimeloyl-ACP methyl ester carboxylesterase